MNTANHKSSLHIQWLVNFPEQLDTFSSSKRYFVRIGQNICVIRKIIFRAIFDTSLCKGLKIM